MIKASFDAICKALDLNLLHNNPSSYDREN